MVECDGTGVLHGGGRVRNSSLRDEKRERKREREKEIFGAFFLENEGIYFYSYTLSVTGKTGP